MFPPENAISRESGGGGNRTRETFPPESDRAWAAGLFEGEGTIGYQVQAGGRIRLRFALGTTDEDVLVRFRSIVDCGNIIGPKWREMATKPIWIWSATSRADAVHLTEFLLPYLGTRRRDALERAWHEYATQPPRRNHNSEKTHCKYGHPLSGDNLIIPPGKRRCRICERRRDLESKKIHVAELYRCSISLDSAPLHGSRSSTGAEPDFVTPLSLETGLCDVARGRAMSLDDRSPYQGLFGQRRGRSRAHFARPREGWGGSEALVGEKVDPARMVLPGALHPLAGGCVEREHRQRLLGRNAVPPVHLAVRRRHDAGVSGVAAGAAVPRLAGVAQGRPLLEGMGNGRCLRSEVSGG